MRFFFYGTLIDADVRRVVLGDEGKVEPAILRGWRVASLRGTRYATIVPDRKQAVGGVLIRGISRPIARRLTRYEGDEYESVRLPVRLRRGRTINAQVFVARRRYRAPQGWDFAAWKRRYKRLFLATMGREPRAL